MSKIVSDTYISRKCFGKNSDFNEELFNELKASLDESLEKSSKERKKKSKNFQKNKFGLGYLRGLSHSIAPHFKLLTPLERAFVQLFWNEKRFHKSSYSEAVKELNFRDRRVSRRFFDELEEFGLIKVKETFYKKTNIRGRNIYTLKKNGEVFLKAILNKSFKGEAVPYEIYPKIVLEKGTVRRMLKKEKQDLKTNKNQAHKAKVTKVTKNICRENLGFLGSSSKESKNIQKEFEKVGLGKYLEEANVHNLKHVCLIPVEILRKTLRKMKQRLKNVRHFWKYLTVLLNDAIEKRLAWPKKRAKDIRDAVDGINSKSTTKLKSGVDTQAVVDSIQEIELHQTKTFSEQELGKIILAAKCNTSKLRVALEKARGSLGNKKDLQQKKMPYQKGTVSGVKRGARFYYKTFDCYSRDPKLTVYAIPEKKVMFQHECEVQNYCRRRGIALPEKTKNKVSTPNKKFKPVRDYTAFLMWLLKKNFTNKSELYKGRAL